MKHLLLFFIALNVSVLSISQVDYKTEEYKNPQMIDSSNANSITSFKNTPESVVTYFYASKIRKDKKWEEVILPEKARTNRLNTKLEDYKNWIFHKFKLVSITKTSEKTAWIKIFMEIEYKGSKDAGTDDVSVKLINGKWIITSVPT